MAGSFDGLAPFGWTDRVLALFNAVGDDGLVPARIARVNRGGARAVLPDGRESKVRTTTPCAVGDWVAVDGNEVHTVLDRWSALSRLDPNGVDVQVLAANIDLVFITAPGDRLSPARVERELSVAWDSGAQPMVVVTKADLADGDAIADLQQRLVGADIIVSSAVTGDGVEAVRAALQPNRTAVLLGPSGAGKSTLANALLGTDTLATADVRDSDQRGRHTTTARQLVNLPGGGVLIDTPGLRSLGLAGDGDGIRQAFSDIDALAAGCRFRDCAHDGEPGCAVAEAVERGELDPERFASFHKLAGEVSSEARRSDPLLRKQQLGQVKSLMKDAREIGRRKQR